MLGKVLENVPGYGDKLGSSCRIDHLLDVLLGFGAVLTKINTDVILDNVDSYLVDATSYPSYLEKILGTGRFLQLAESESVHGSKQQTQFYEMLIEAETAQATLREYRKLKNPEDVANYKTAHAQELSEEKILTPVKKVGKINSKLKLTLRFQTMDADQKKAAIDSLLIQRQQAFEAAVGMMQRIGRLGG